MTIPPFSYKFYRPWGHGHVPVAELYDDPRDQTIPYLRGGILQMAGIGPLPFSSRDGEDVVFKDPVAGHNFTIGFEQPEEWFHAVALYYDYKAVEEAEAVGTEELYVLEDDGLNLPESGWQRQHRRVLTKVSSRLAARYVIQRRVDELTFRYPLRKLIRTDIKGDEYLLIVRYQVEERWESGAILQDPEFENRAHRGGFGHGTKGAPMKRLHVSRLAPVQDPGTSMVEEVIEEGSFLAGDPRLLRDSASGQFGSYPSFEGDDESE